MTRNDMPCRRLAFAALALAALLCAPSLARAEETAAREGLKIDLLPIELTAFGDVRFRTADGEKGAFQIGAVEVDAALALYRNVSVAVAFAYDSSADVVRLSAFTVDGGLAGEGPRHLFQAPALETSGLIFGKFDVPFGIAYLRYPSTENRLVETASPVLAVHGAWNDYGVQAYVAASWFNAVAYMLNGSGVPAPDDGRPEAEYAVGGRAGIKPLGSVEAGCSCALVAGAAGARQLLYGADASFRTEWLELENEYLARRPDGGALVQGFYSQALGRIGPAFATARYEMLWEGDALADCVGTLGVGAEVQSRGELRLVYLRSLEHERGAFMIQVVGGSVFQPTGLRR